jgi:hypothetical protein
VTIVGYTKEGFILRNSWGADWADKGYVIYPFGDFGAHWEIWSTIDESSPEPDDRVRGKCMKYLTCIRST